MRTKSLLGLLIATATTAACGGSESSRPAEVAGGDIDAGSVDDSSTLGGDGAEGPVIAPGDEEAEGASETAESGTVDVDAGGVEGDAAADAACAVMAGPVDRTSTGGNYVLEFGELYLEVTRAGGKVLTFRRAAGQNVLTGPSVNPTYFGSSLWVAPQFPPADEIDTRQLPTVTATDTSVTMTSDVALTRGPKVRVTKTYAANLCARAVDIEYVIDNADTVPQSFAIWEVTRVAPNGLSFFEKGSVYPDSSFTVGAQIADQAGCYWYDEAVATVPNAKLKADGTSGWLAYTNGTDLFVKKWPDVPAASRVPGEGEIEIWDQTDQGQRKYNELETQGPYGPVAPGASTHLEVRWTLEALTGKRTIGDPGLIAAVRRIVE